MKINNCTINRAGSSSISADKKVQTGSSQGAEQKNYAKVPLFSYIANSNISFGHTTELPVFDIEQLSDAKMDEEFDRYEGVSPNNDVNISCLTNLSAQYITEQIRYIENLDTLVPYKEREIREYNRNSSEAEIQDKIELEKQNFVEHFNQEKQRAINEIEKVNPTKKPHTVYRIINKDNTPLSEKYFDKIDSLNKGDEVVLDSAPLYVSTSPKRVLTAYGRPQEGVLFQIELPANSKIAKFPSFDGINQLLMKPDSKFEVTDVQEFKDNFKLINLKYQNEIE